MVDSVVNVSNQEELELGVYRRHPGQIGHLLKRVVLIQEKHPLQIRFFFVEDSVFIWFNGRK